MGMQQHRLSKLINSRSLNTNKVKALLVVAGIIILVSRRSRLDLQETI